jgi:putative DNA primase/helicase
MIGKENVATPSLNTLGGRFGLAPLLGKQAAIVADAHLGRTSDAVSILECLKSIVGGDAKNIDRKGKEELTDVPINCKFTIAANELPRFPDSSAALKSRLIVQTFDRSFEGQEDHALLEKLLKEIPGITMWALRGLTRLRQRGHFIQPQAGIELLNTFVRLSAPVQAFLDDWCLLGPEYFTTCADLYAAWRLWCEENGHLPGSQATFGVHLKSARHKLERKRKRIINNGASDQTWCYVGVGLAPHIQVKVNNLGVFPR